MFEQVTAQLIDRDGDDQPGRLSALGGQLGRRRHDKGRHQGQYGREYCRESMVDGIHKKSNCSFIRKAFVTLTHANTPPTPVAQYSSTS